MSSALSNFSVSLPFKSDTKPTSARFQAYFGPGSKGFSNKIRATAGGERRDNLDHLQKVGKTQSTQQTKRPVQVASPIVLWDRFPTAKTVQQMMDTMERVMEDPLAYSTTWPTTLPRENGNGGYRRERTPWDIKEGENDYKLRFDMPGMTKSDVKVWVEEKMLVVKAEKQSTKKESAEGTDAETEEIWSAKSYGRYSSRIALPENVEFEKIRLRLKMGFCI